MVILNVMEGGRPRHDTCPEISNEIWSVLERCWDSDPIRRPSINALSLLFNVTRALRQENENLSDSEAIHIADIADGKGNLVWGQKRHRTNSSVNSVVSSMTANRILRAFNGHVPLLPLFRHKPAPSNVAKQNGKLSKLKDAPYACQWPACHAQFSV